MLSRIYQTLGFDTKTEDVKGNSYQYMNESLDYSPLLELLPSHYHEIRYILASGSAYNNSRRCRKVDVKLGMSDKEFNAMLNCSNTYMMDDTSLWDDVNKVLEREVYHILQDFYAQCKGKVVIFYPLDFEEDCPSTGFYLLKEGDEFWLRAKYEVFKEVITCK